MWAVYRALWVWWAVRCILGKPWSVDTLFAVKPSEAQAANSWHGTHLGVTVGQLASCLVGGWFPKLLSIVYPVRFLTPVVKRSP